MSAKNKFLGLLIVSVLFSIFTIQAQVVVTIRPALPRYERVVAPSPRHVWVEEEWEPRNGGYVFVGGHWMEPPYERAFWVPGRWVEHRRGWFWKPGHWKRRR